jgi:1-acyl-sn-glycerol-3-phosphate acyltransferase
VIRKALFLPVATASTLFFSLVAVVGGLVRAPKGLFDWIHRNWARSVLGAAGVRIEAKGLEHVHEGRAYVFVSNHQSFFDVWTMMATLPASIRFVAKQELARIPIFAAACRAAGHVFIDRRDAVAAGEAIRVAGQQMEKEGLSLFFFPEGTRSADGKLRRFKKGSFALAIETQLELVGRATEHDRAQAVRDLSGPDKMTTIPPVGGILCPPADGNGKTGRRIHVGNRRR